MKCFLFSVSDGAALCDIHRPEFSQLNFQISIIVSSDLRIQSLPGGGPLSTRLVQSASLFIETLLAEHTG